MIGYFDYPTVSVRLGFAIYFPLIFKWRILQFGP